MNTTFPIAVRLFKSGIADRRGFSMIEAVTAVAIVTIACSAMLVSVGHAIDCSEVSQGTNRSNSLAQDLMHEISTCRWSDPQTPTHWGPEPDEGLATTRAAFDDIDDYDRWSGPPQNKSGVRYDTMQQRLFPGSPPAPFDLYRCSVSVEEVSAAGEPLPIAETSSYRRVIVRITHPEQSPVEISRIFADYAAMFGRRFWHAPNAVEGEARVTFVSD